MGGLFLLFFSLLFPSRAVVTEPFEEAERKGQRNPFALELELTQDSLLSQSWPTLLTLVRLGPSWVLGYPSAELLWLQLWSGGERFLSPLSPESPELSSTWNPAPGVSLGQVTKCFQASSPS